ncbi:MAG: flagellar basal body protein FliL [Hyphomicrobiales bacterium]|jgi:flagellar FliL protein|nr:flagellar basal body protein FliL [Hyphomicrobiales bacterium]
MASKKGEDGGKKSAGGLVSIILLTLLAGGAGAAHGLQVFKAVHVPVSPEGAKPAAPAAPAAPAPPPAPAAGAEPAKLPSKIVVKDLPHVLTNVAMPPESWIRLEASIVYDQADIANVSVLAGEISNDLLAFLRSVSLREIQGPEGLAYLRQDMKDRVALRSDGKVKDLVIQTLVVQ